MKSVAIIAAVAGLSVTCAFAQTKPVGIVAAENFYGDVANQIGGKDVKVSSIMSNPDTDPHLFEVSPSVARSVSAARVVVYSGIDYDPWMEKILSAAKSGDRKVIVVANLVGKKTGDNPHVWYDPATMLAYAKALTDMLSTEDPAHKDDYAQRLASFEDSLKPIQDKITELHDRLNGTPATATEPIFGYMFDLLGMQVRNDKFQLAVMNNTEPAASDVAAFESDLKTHQVKLLIYNSQASDPVAVRMQKIAKAFKIPMVGATETEPKGKNYQAWMMSELTAVDKALPK